MNTENVITTIERRKGDKKIKQNLVKTQKMIAQTNAQ